MSTEVDVSFPKSKRLLKSNEFKRVLAKGRKFVCRELVVFTLKAPAFDARLGLIVGRRVGNAVKRNRIKRRLRDVFRHLPVFSDGMDVVVIARGSAEGASHGDLTRALRKSLQKHLA